MQKVIQKKLSNGQNETYSKYFIALSYLAEMPSLFKSYLLEFFEGDAKRAWECTKEDLRQFDISVPRNFISEKANIDPDKVYEDILKRGMSFVTVENKNYPKLLKELPDYPLVLYYEGDLSACNLNRTLAVVGSRKASESAKAALEGIISTMANTDILIVSGLAYGIDATAHKAALDNGIKTVGIIASGLDTQYPSSNKGLYKRIREGGGVVMSEYPPGVPPLSHHFPQRNRIVTGLSYGTLVAEAALKSGAMISANLTLEQNRELMCMPGLISNPNTEGIYKLLKDGAHLVTSAQDVFDTLGWELQKSNKTSELSKDERAVFDAISTEHSEVEQIQAQSGLETSQLMIVLTGLELKGLIKQIRGKYFTFGIISNDGTDHNKTDHKV